MPVLKRPASGNAAPVSSKKRPGASKETISDVVAEMKDRSNAESDQGEEDNEDGEKRDKGKAEKFAKMLAKGQLPHFVVQMWEHGHKSAPEGSRKFKTTLINTLMKRDATGQYRLDTDSHQFKEYQRTWENHVSSDRKHAMPKHMFAAHYFHGDEKQLQKSLDAGELKLTRDEESGQEFYTWRTLKITDSKGKEAGEKVDGAKKLKKGEAHEVAGLMKKLHWDFAFSKAVLLKMSLILAHSHVPCTVYNTDFMYTSA